MQCLCHLIDELGGGDTEPDFGSPQAANTARRLFLTLRSHYTFIKTFVTADLPLSGTESEAEPTNFLSTACQLVVRRVQICTGLRAGMGLLPGASNSW